MQACLAAEAEVALRLYLHVSGARVAEDGDDPIVFELEEMEDAILLQEARDEREGRLTSWVHTSRLG
ncbi:hypothetical protein BE21_19340 [Sorangium cellulosum]|uniref:Uncharacterized protein n=1 Tax=Sorangium cellulosum TaxID=56 RepID=A0A150TWX2_SORCE|nr:hypothetical protein BE21_19340 [Sorangium cellulosum]